VRSMDRKHLVFIFATFISLQNLFSLSFSARHYDSIVIKDGSLIYYNNLIGTEEQYEAALETVDNMLYVNFYYDGKFLDGINRDRNVAHGQKRFLVLYLNSCSVRLYDETNNWFYGVSEYWYSEYNIRSEVTATSELREGDILYSAKNILDDCFLMPWAEGKAGSGIGEKISFSVIPSKSVIHKVYPPLFRGALVYSELVKDDTIRYKSIIMSNGFVDYNRPYLYEQNNRVKKIRVSRGNPGDYVDFEVKDTPQMQYFYFGDKLKAENNTLEIEILEVYKGSKYDDTCINFITPLSVGLEIFP